MSKAAGLIKARVITPLLARVSRASVIRGCLLEHDSRAVSGLRGWREIVFTLGRGASRCETLPPGTISAAGDAPHLLARGPRLPWIRGWYRLEWRIATDSLSGTARLWVDYGDGFNKADAVSLPFVSGRLHKRQICFSRRVRGLRLDVVGQKDVFALEQFDLYPSLVSYAKQAMLNHLAGRPSHSSAHSGGHASVWAAIRSAAEKRGVDPLVLLYERYSATYTRRGDSGMDYARWIAHVESYSIPERTHAQKVIAGMASKPLLSIVMPVYDPVVTYLKEAIDSVLSQWYPFWELCIADDASPNPVVQELLADYAKNDARIKVVFRKSNGHISAASNSALALATGRFVVLLDHDDLLAPYALYFIAKAVEDHPDARIFYSDEDKIDTRGVRYEPHFKGDWNPDLFYSQNYVSHLGVYERRLIEQVNGFRIGVEGSQDHDLLLRCLSHVCFDQIVHVPRVLYHWRAVDGSTARSAREKAYSEAAGVEAVKSYFSGIGAHEVRVAAGQLPHTYRVRWPVPLPSPLVTLLIPTRDKRELLECCVRSILSKTTYGNYEVIILDNGSVEPSTHAFFRSIEGEDSRVRVVSYDRPFNYSAINNFGVEQANGSLIGLINNDVEIIAPGWLEEMVSHAVRPDIACVGAKLYYPDNTIQHAGVVLGLGGVAGHSHKYFERGRSGYFGRLSLVQNVSAVTAACLLVSKGIYEELGGLNESDLPVAFNDVDLCLRAREAGYRNLWTPYAELYHHESKSRGEEDTPAKQARFEREVAYMRRTWGEALIQDPYYNPNLTRTREDFSLGVTPIDVTAAC